MLRTVLAFYDRFAGQNASNPKLQGESAWAYRKVGILCQWLGETEKAKAAYARSIRIFEDLISRHPNDPIYITRLVDTYDMADPKSTDPADLEIVLGRLRRARTFSGRLTAEWPDNDDYALARLHILAKLGMTAQRLDQARDAEAAYREAIALATDLIARLDNPIRPRRDRMIVSESLAALLIDQGATDQARASLDSAVADLHLLLADPYLPAPPPSRFESLAAAYRTLGDDARADAILAESRSRPRRPGRGPGPGGPPDRPEPPPDEPDPLRP